jgi:hypothetical protein
MKQTKSAEVRIAASKGHISFSFWSKDEDGNVTAEGNVDVTDEPGVLARRIERLALVTQAHMPMIIEMLTKDEEEPLPPPEHIQ